MAMEYLSMTKCTLTPKSEFPLAVVRSGATVTLHSIALAGDQRRASTVLPGKLAVRRGLHRPADEEEVAGQVRRIPMLGLAAFVAVP